MKKSMHHITWNDIGPLTSLLRIPGKKITFVIHVNPDGDALGSALGLLNLFGKMGHSCKVVSPNNYPGFLKWLPGSDQVILMDKSPADARELIQQADLLFAVDFNDLKRTKKLYEVFHASKAYKVMIDHHPGPEMEADCILSDTSASSTAELMYRFIREASLINWMDRDIASCLFVGIMTDTGCFSYNSSNRNTWLIVAELLDYGIDKDRLYYLTYDNYSSHRMRLLGFSLNVKMEVFPEYRTGIIWLTREDLRTYHFEAGDTEGFVNYPLSIRGIRFSALFIEKEDHVRISFRSKGDFAVNVFSKKYFNGGGHANASGGESYQSITDTIKRFKELLPVYQAKLCDYEV